MESSISMGLQILDDSLLLEPFQGFRGLGVKKVPTNELSLQAPVSV